CRAGLSLASRAMREIRGPVACRGRTELATRRACRALKSPPERAGGREGHARDVRVRAVVVAGDARVADVELHRDVNVPEPDRGPDQPAGPEACGRERDRCWAELAAPRFGGHVVDVDVVPARPHARPEHVEVAVAL